MGEVSISTDAEIDRSRRTNVSMVLFGLQQTYEDGLRALRDKNDDALMRRLRHLRDIRSSLEEELDPRQSRNACPSHRSQRELEYLSQATMFYERRLLAVRDRSESTGTVRERFWDGGWPRPARVKEYFDPSAPRLTR